MARSSARSFARKKSLEAMSEIDVTPLIDLAFSLLIIFMISTPMMNQKEAPIPVALPITGGAPDPGNKDEFQTLTATRTGELYFGRDKVTAAEMDRRLAALAGLPKPPVLSIRGEGEGKYQHVVTLLNLVKKNKLSRISLDTEVKN